MKTSAIGYAFNLGENSCLLTLMCEDSKVDFTLSLSVERLFKHTTPDHYIKVDGRLQTLGPTRTTEKLE
jgi:hypothetical protein